MNKETKTMNETSNYKVGDLVIIRDERIDTSTERQRGYRSGWDEKHKKRNILVSGKLGQQVKSSWSGKVSQNDEGRIIKILSESESDNGNRFLIGFGTKDISYYNKDKYKKHTIYTKTKTHYNNEEIEVEYVYVTGCLLNETNFIGKGSDDDVKNQIEKIQEEKEEIENSIVNYKQDLMELSLKESVLQKTLMGVK
jgi:hypothetical protein